MFVEVSHILENFVDLMALQHEVPLDINLKLLG